MKYYRVYTNFTEYIPIDSTEIERAMYAFITESSLLLNNGAITRIDRIVPDFHREMGWNPTHKIGPDDDAELASKGISHAYHRAIGTVRERVLFLMEHGKTELIGKNIPIHELSAPQRPELQGATKALADKMRAR